LIVEDSAGTIAVAQERMQVHQAKGGLVEWHADSKAGSITMDVRGGLEFDGFARFKVTSAPARH